MQYAKHTPLLTYHLSTRVVSINAASKTITCLKAPFPPTGLPTPPDSAASDSGTESVAEDDKPFDIPYDILVMATGSSAILPQHTPGHNARGAFVYRTVADLESLIAFAASRRGTTGAVVGGGLLGLEAAKAMLDLGEYATVNVIERNRWLLSRQLDGEAGSMVVEQVRDLGVGVMLSRRVGRIEVWDDEDTTDPDLRGSVKAVVFEDGDRMECSTVCFAIGIRPRDELARAAGFRCADRGGGIIVGDDLAVEGAEDVYAIGECASWKGQGIYGLIGPGVEMADVLAFNLTQAKLHEPRRFKTPDLSTKLKLLGVEVASFGDFFADRDGPKFLPAKARRAAAKAGKTAGGAEAALKTLTDGPPPPPVKALTYKDPFQNVYKKYLFTPDGKYLLGGMMIGDTKDYIKLVPLVKNQKELEMPPAELIVGAAKKGDGGDDGDDLTDDTQICSCHNVTKGDVVNATKDGTCTSIGDIKSCTKAGTGCGGCLPLVTSIFNATMKAMGNEVKNHLCPHFAYSRVDLYNIIRVKRLTTLADVMREAGTDKDSVGCEACKPAIASIFASLWNGHVMSPATHGLQDTNDRFLGNIQRNGTFSVIPRIAGGEITPDKLIAIGETARKYGLYTKITGGQRIDMFGARKQDLLDIWKRLVDAGMESGHAYAKSLRTVKSCVGTTWCRFGVGDSVGMAVRIEERYKSIRSPHKIKGAVSGCVRECAEAQNKDFGLIATEKGFNIFVAGNGGAKPKHAELLATDVPPSEVIPILDRYLMFYISTADKLQRTARWLEALPGGINYLKDVILRDSLGICASLEAQMQELVDSYFDEWAEAVTDPAIAAKFRQFANTDETVDGMETEVDRGQSRPVYWPRESATEDFKGLRNRWSSLTWQPVLEASYFAGADDMPNGLSAAIKRGDTQLAIFRVRGKYYATQQMCPHKRAFVLSDGLIGQEVPSAANATSNGAATDAQGQANSAPSPAPWVSCPHHKRNYDLVSGSCRSDDALSIATFDVEERADGWVYLNLPPVEELDAALGTSWWRVKKDEPSAPGCDQGGPFAELDRKIGFDSEKPMRKTKRTGARAVKPELAMRRPVEILAGGGGCGAAPEW